MNKTSVSMALLAALCSVAIQSGQAQDTASAQAAATTGAGDQSPIQTVAVNGIKDPEIRSYRAMLAGLDAFDKHRGLAPTAPELRFRLSPLSNDAGAGYAGLGLRIRGDTVSIPVPIDADDSFVLPRSQEAADDNADLVLDLRKGQIRGRPDIHTPGVPANARRLGDLRLECEVRGAIAKADMNFMFRGAVAALTLGNGLCSSPRMRMGFYAGRPIRDVTLLWNGKQEALARFSGAHYFPPVGDKNWPDDTLLKFNFEETSGTK